ncbi:hypothetical protein KFE25_008687 [Diacronema lutheri]|uniref:Actin-related protein 6 n=1 Tax=Diacronema lutheri TaxID=2081491 RepID=A0A8J5XWE1_DIALT|nr:hypothetical protein KFE25_008687 [Diacronema lutheri]
MAQAAGTIVVLDNGGHTCKAGFAGQVDPKRIVPNLIAKSKAERKTFVGDQFDACTDFSGLQYRLALEKGYPINWETEAEVWTRIFGKDVLAVNTADCRLMLSTPPLCPSSILATINEIVFEHFNFQSLCSACPQLLASYAQQAELEARSEPQPAATLVVDCGFSSTHIVPIFDAQAINFGIRRLAVGGKVLTNHLKQVISHRQWNVMDETHMINDVKEQMCYVSLDLAADLRAAAVRRGSAITREFVMPDYIHVTRGYVKPVVVDVDADASADASADAAGDRGGCSGAADGAGASVGAAGGARTPGPPAKKARPPDGSAVRGGGGGSAAGGVSARGGEAQQVLALGVERFGTGEVLFYPSDIGLDEAGIPEAIVQAVGATLPDLHEALYSNIVLTGGTAKLPNLAARLEAELRQLVPADFALNVRPAADPIVAAWRGASHFASGPLFERSSVSRDEYLEHGHAFVKRVCHN